MNYSELLSKYIEESGLSLGELAVRLSSRGINIDRSYISKLKNGNKPPASEDVSRALAEVTGGDPDKLIIAGQIERLTPVLEDLGEEGFNEFLNSIAELYAKKFPLEKLNEMRQEEAEAQGIPFRPVSQEEWDAVVAKMDYETKIDLSRYYSFRIETKDGKTIDIPSISNEIVEENEIELSKEKELYEELGFDEQPPDEDEVKVLKIALQTYRMGKKNKQPE